MSIRLLDLRKVFSHFYVLASKVLGVDNYLPQKYFNNFKK